MSAFVNDRDILLQATVPRNITPTLGKTLVLNVDPVAFHVKGDGTGAPAFATFTALPIGMPGVVTWTSDAGAPLSGTADNVRTMAFGTMTVERAQVTATLVYKGQTYEDKKTMWKIADGAAGVNYTWIKYATSDVGAVLSDIPVGMTYIGLAYNKPTAVESTDPADYTWSLIKGTDGVPGAPGANGQPTYTWIKYSDNVDGSGLYDTPTAATLYIGIAVNKSVIAESTVKTDYTWSKFKGDQGVAGQTGSHGQDGSPGQRGTVNIAASGYSAWSDAAASAAISGAGYGAPVNSDMVTLYNSSFSQSRFYSNGFWLTIAAYIHGNMFVDGTLSVDKLIAGILTGFTFQTATSGQRVTINESGNGAIQFYDFSGAGICSIGVGGALIAYAGSSSPGVGAFSTSGGGNAISASATAGGYALLASASGSSSTAIYADGGITMPSRAAGDSNTVINSVIASMDNAYECGYIGARWANIFAVNNVIQTSDSRTKTDVADSDLGLAFITSLRPVSYRMIVGHNNVRNDWVIPYVEPVVTVTPRPGSRLHYGLIAQEVKAALGDENIAIWSLDDKEDPDSSQALTYTELIAPLIKAVQEQQQMILALTERVFTLEQQFKS